MKDQCKQAHDPSVRGSSGRRDLLESCLLFNGNPSNSFNFLANLCFTESLTYSETGRFAYPNLNIYYCLGWKASAMKMQMIYDPEVEDCLNIGNMKLAERCLQKIQSKFI